MKTIYKFEIVLGTFIIDLPKDAKIISVHTQHKVPMMWVLLDTDKPKMRRVFSVFGTGHELPDNESLIFIGTFLANNDTLVYHVFEDCA